MLITECTKTDKVPVDGLRETDAVRSDDNASQEGDTNTFLHYLYVEGGVTARRVHRDLLCAVY